MSWNNLAQSSGKQFYAGSVTTSNTVLYTAPNYSTNVTSPSATAIIKEITISNTSATTLNIYITISGQTLLANSQISPYSTTVLQLNTMLNAFGTISAQLASGSGLVLIISGVEVQ